MNNDDDDDDDCLRPVSQLLSCLFYEYLQYLSLLCVFLRGGWGLGFFDKIMIFQFSYLMEEPDFSYES